METQQLKKLVGGLVGCTVDTLLRDPEFESCCFNFFHESPNVKSAQNRSLGKKYQKNSCGEKGLNPEEKHC